MLCLLSSVYFQLQLLGLWGLISYLVLIREKMVDFNYDRENNTAEKKKKKKKSQNPAFLIFERLDWRTDHRPSSSSPARVVALDAGIVGIVH